MRIGIYNEPSGSIGGSEYVVSVLADALAQRHHVDVIHHNRDLTVNQLVDLSGLCLSNVRLRFISRQDRPDLSSPSGLRNLRRRHQAQVRWHEDLSRPYDVFITSTHNLPPFCHARIGVMLTLFPLPDRMILWPWADDARSGGRSLKQRIGRKYYNWLWQKRFDSYCYKLSISEYTRKWTRAWWGIDTDILYPPVDTQFEPTPKANLVLSVGRFSTCSHSKRQVDTMNVFRDMKGTWLQDWCYYSVGGLVDHPADHAYFGEVTRIAAECGAQVIPNIRRGDLRSLFAKAKIFWHAAGYGGDDAMNPFEAEHFGISTVEAMAAGAVPIVYDKGGQSEIVEHERSGYLWRSLDELREYTRRLAQDGKLREQMAAAARRRAERFSREAFLDSFARLVPVESAVVSHSNAAKTPPSNRVW
jgi:glycosyltransferase involved in cell wall biosynthesis